jgi:hypothetical protein
MDGIVAWYITCYFGGYPVQLLVDTGSQITMLNKFMFDRIPNKMTPVLREYCTPLTAANGDSVKTYGFSDEFVMGIGRNVYNGTVVVADMGRMPGILGMDFLNNVNASISCGSGTIQIGTEIIQCQPDQIGNGRVTVCEYTELPPGHVCYVNAELTAFTCNENSVGVIEPLFALSNRSGLLIARGTVDLSQSKVSVQVVNVTQHCVSMQEGDVIAYVEPVDEVFDEIYHQSDDVNHVSSVSYNDISPDEENSLPSHLQPLLNNINCLSDDQLLLVKNLLHKYECCFEGGKYGLGVTHLVSHRIDTGDHPPIKIPPRRMGPEQRKIVDEEVDKMLKKGVIEPSDSPWSFPPVLVKKKDSTYRFCIDYRRLNTVSKSWAYPLPRIDDCLDALSGAKFFCCLDLASGYWQIPMHEEDKNKTAFSTHRGLFHFNVMPFGVKSGPATLEHLMDLLLRGLTWQSALVYMDDVICFGKTFESTFESLESVLQRFRHAGLRLKPKKCILFQSEVSFLGYTVSHEGLSPQPCKLSAVRDWATPTDVASLRNFLGFASYYRRFLPDFATIASPLYELTGKKVKFVWSDKCEESFLNLKKGLITSPVLAFPVEGCQMILDTDASDYGISGVLSQIVNDEEKVLCYSSKRLNKSQRNYCTTYKELLAVVKMVQIYRPYLYGQHVIVRTDHHSLTWLQRFKNPEGMLARWLSVLSEYDLEFVYRPGKLHTNADGLSRQRRTAPCKRLDCPDLGHLSPQCVSTVAEWNRVNEFRFMNCAPITEEVYIDSQEQVLDETSQENAEIYQHRSNWLDTFTDQELKEMQLEDEYISLVRNWVQDSTRPAFEVISNCSSTVKNLWAQFNHLSFINDKLVRKCILPDKTETYQLVVPTSLRRKIFQHLHQYRVGGHLGVSKTISSLRQRFYWPEYRDDIIRWCSWCERCQLRKMGHQKRAKLQQCPVGAPMERIALDIVGPLNETRNGNKYILVICDYFTKWVEAFALPDQKSLTVADCLVTQVICRFGCPHQIHSDKASDFMSHLFCDICSLLGIKKTNTTPYRPQSDGLVERMNRTLQDILAKFVNDHRDDWDDHIPYALCAYRATPHESTKMTPNRLMLGRECTLPVDLVYGKLIPDPGSTCYVEYVEWVREAAESAFDIVRKELKKASIRQARHYNKLSGDPSYKVGDWVLLYYPPVANQKLGLKFIGPFQVLEVISEVCYRIKSVKTGKDRVVHVNHLKLYRSEVLPGDELHFDDMPMEEELEEGIEEEEINDTEREQSEDILQDALHLIDEPRRRQTRAPNRYGDWII